MARNIEIKARVDGLEALELDVAMLADDGPFDIEQDDTFFHCERGRLKLRVLSDRSGELIWYRRPDCSGPKESFYIRTPAAEPDSLREALALACGERARVRKHRTVYMAGRTRIHLDRVEGLGDYMELEVALDDGEAPQAGFDEARSLMEQLGINGDSLVDSAYVDLIERGGAA